MATPKKMAPLTKVFRLASATPTVTLDFAPGNDLPFTLHDLSYIVVDTATGKVLDTAEPVLRLTLNDVNANTDITNGSLPLNAVRRLMPYRLPSPIAFGKGNVLRATLATDAAAVASASYDVYVTLHGEKG